MNQTNNRRTEQSRLATVSWFMFEIFFYVIAIAATGVMLLGLLQLSRLLAGQIQMESPIIWFSAAISASLLYKFLRHSIFEAIEMLARALDHFLIRLFTVLVAGSSESSRNPR